MFGTFYGPAKTNDWPRSFMLFAYAPPDRGYWRWNIWWTRESRPRLHWIHNNSSNWTLRLGLPWLGALQIMWQR